MKKLLISLLLGFITLGVFASDPISIIEGTWERGRTNQIKLFKITDGALEEIASSKLNDKNKFYFAFTVPEEGIYVVGTNANAFADNYSFYFKPGDRLQVTINPTSYILTGDNTKENMELAAWEEFTFPLQDIGIYYMGKITTYVDYFPLLETKLKELKKYKQKYKGNKIFNQRFSKIQEYDILLSSMLLLSTPRTAHPQGEDYPDYYNQIDLERITSDNSLLEYPFGISLLKFLEMDNFRRIKQKDNSADHHVVGRAFLERIKSPELRGEYIATQMISRQKNYQDLLAFEKEYGQYLVTDKQKQALLAVKSNLISYAPGSDAIDFKFNDIEGNEVALSDFTGKVVYVDIWATWCGPCVKEIPYLKELEKEYHGKDVVFMSVSVDSERDKQKWENYVKKEELGGVQLFAGRKGQEGIMYPYKVSGIPRFMLFDKAGKILNVDADRPSSGDVIRNVLNEALSK